MFRIRCERLLSLCVNAVILETASFLVSPDYVCSPFYVYCPFVFYTCLQSTSPFALRTPLRFTIATSPYESLRVARRLSITSFELPRYTTKVFDFDVMCAYEVQFERKARYFFVFCELVALRICKNRDSLPSYISWGFSGVLLFLIAHEVARDFRVCGEHGFSVGK